MHSQPAAWPCPCPSHAHRRWSPPAHMALALHRGCPRPGQQSSHIVLPILFPPVLHSLPAEAIHALMALNALTSTVPNLTSNVLISERIPNCFPYRRPSIKHCNGCFKFCYVAIYSMKIYQRKNRFPHRANLKQLILPFHLSCWKLGPGVLQAQTCPSHPETMHIDITEH